MKCQFFLVTLFALVYSINAKVIPINLSSVKIICQKNIPFTITTSGEYKLGENITFNQPGNAITIKADNVKLHLDSFSITVTDPGATGILVDSVTEFLIDSDAIKNVSSSAQTGTGIEVINSEKGRINNILTINFLNGLSIENSSDITIKNSHFSSASNAGAFVKDSTNIVCNTDVFENSGNGLVFNGKNQDCEVLNSKFPSSVLANLLVQQINGLIVDNCLFSNIDGSNAKLSLVQFGDVAANQLCHDVIFKNCTIVNRPLPGGNTAPEGLGIYQGSGFLVESCVIDIDNTNQDPAADLSGIHISNPGLGTGTIASDVIIRNCVVQGPSTNGFYPDVGTTNVVIEDCLATGAQKNGIFLAGTSFSNVKNNTVVSNGTNGIFLGETSIANAINNNVVANNGFNPIVTSLPPTGNGISIASDSSLNTVQYNEVFNNAVNGVDDQGTGNRIFFNTAYGNGGVNYFAATDTIIRSIPGAPSLAAENINA